MGEITLIILVVIYFIPSLTAMGKKQAGSVFVLNLLLGWTLIGWVVAMAWAVYPDPNKAKA